VSYVKAIGPVQGDFLELTNKWARIVITREDESASHPALPLYAVTGDIADSGTRVVMFTTMSGAVGYAMESLALFQEGRAS
jgi:hypothetical protein